MFYCRSLLSVSALVLLLSACASTTHVANFDQTLQQDYIPLEEELWANEQADKFHAEFVKQGLLYNDETMLAYLAAIKSRLLQDSDLEKHIHLYLLRAPTPNAFALPNGNIYINTGLFSAVSSEQQLAAIIGHEIAHVTQRHGVEGVIDRKNTLVGAHVADLLTGGFGLVYFGAVANIMHYSREQEWEADKEGFELLTAAHYPPSAMLEAFQAFQQHPELKHVKQSVYSTHPSYQNRIASLQEFVANYSASTPDAVATAAIDAATFTHIRTVLIEENIRIRLRYRQFNLASSILDELSPEALSQSKREYYRGEVSLGFYKYPKAAAKEEHWINTGKNSEDSALLSKYQQQKKQNLTNAITAYEAALAQPDALYPPAYKRLGDALALQGEKTAAMTAYQQYLQAAPAAKDRRYIEYKLKKIQQ